MHPIDRQCRATRSLRAVLVGLVLLTACGGDDDQTTSAPESTTSAVSSSSEETMEPTPAPFALTSTAFEDGGTIPDRYSCRGDDVSPALEWTDPPAGTVAFALVMDDPDAVPVAGKVWDHWVLWGLPGDTRSLPESVAADASPSGAVQGENSFGRIGYGGPCPPAGHTHDYVFVVHALDAEVDPSGPTKADLQAAMEGHILAEATLIGSFSA